MNCSETNIICLCPKKIHTKKCFASIINKNPQNKNIVKIEILCPIKNLKGLEHFINLKELVCNKNY